MLYHSHMFSMYIYFVGTSVWIVSHNIWLLVLVKLISKTFPFLYMLYIIFGSVNTEPCILAVYLVGFHIPEINVSEITIWEIYHVFQWNSGSQFCHKQSGWSHYEVRQMGTCQSAHLKKSRFGIFYPFKEIWMDLKIIKITWLSAQNMQIS